MSNIQNELNNIKNAMYGKDVRQSIHDAIKTCYDDASVNGNSNMEVIQARGEYETLGKRLEDYSSQLEHKANNSQVVLKGYGTLNDFNEETRKAILENNNIDINYVLGDENVTIENLNSFIQNDIYYIERETIFNNIDFNNCETDTSLNQLYVPNITMKRGVYNELIIKSRASGTINFKFLEKEIGTNKFRVVYDQEIDIVPGENSYKIKQFNITNDNTYYGFYNANGEILYHNNSFDYGETPSGGVYMYMTNVNAELNSNIVLETFDSFPVTFAVKFIRNEHTPKTSVLENEIINIKNGKYVNKVFAFLGDSITEGVATTKTYHDYMSEKIKCINKNYGIGGNDIWAMYERFNNITECDYLFIFGGTNDFGLSQVAETNFRYNVKTLLEAAINKFPSKKIIFITPIHREIFSGQLSDREVNSQGLYLKDYVRMIKEICEEYSIPVLDLYANLGINPNMSIHKSIYFHADDGLHPNEVGHEVIADKIVSFLNTI